MDGNKRKYIARNWLDNAGLLSILSQILIDV